MEKFSDGTRVRTKAIDAAAIVVTTMTITTHQPGGNATRQQRGRVLPERRSGASLHLAHNDTYDGVDRMALVPGAAVHH